MQFRLTNSIDAMTGSLYDGGMKTTKRIWSTWHETQKAIRIARAKGFAKRAAKGETLADIARTEGVSRQKIHALIASLKN
jgi:hypothetical protein